MIRSFFIAFVLTLMSTIVFSQVKLVKEDATKVYENGNRITYVTLDGLENYSNSFLLLQKMVEQEKGIVRFAVVDKKGLFCMYEALAEIEPEVVVDYINKVIKRNKIVPLKSE